MSQKESLFILTLLLLLGMFIPIFQVRGGPPIPGGEGESCDCESAEDCCGADLSCFCHSDTQKDGGVCLP